MFNLDCKLLLDYFDGFDPVDLQLEFDKYAVSHHIDNKDSKIIVEEGVRQLMVDHQFSVITPQDVHRLFERISQGTGQIDLDRFRTWARESRY